MQRINTYRSLFLAFFLMLAFVGLESCGWMGYQDIDTTRKAIVVANAEVRGANFLLQDLIARDVISKTDAQKALDSLQDAEDKLQTALDAVDISGDPVRAESNLQRANMAISIVLKLLAPIAEN